MRMVLRLILACALIASAAASCANDESDFDADGGTDAGACAEITGGVVLSAIWAESPQSVYAVRLDGVIIRFNGEDWCQVFEFEGEPKTEFTAVHGRAGENVYAVGGPGYDESRMVVRFDGSEWSVVFIDLAMAVADGIRDVWVAPSGIAYAAASSGELDVLYSTSATGSDWEVEWLSGYDSERYLSYAVYGTSDDDMFLVGTTAWEYFPAFTCTSTFAIHFDGTDWTETPTPYDQDCSPSAGEMEAGLYDVWASSEDDYVAVGTVWTSDVDYYGTVLSYTGGEWIELAQLPSVQLSAVGGEPGGDLYVGGDALYRYDGSTWQELAVPGDLNDISVDPSGSAWVAGSGWIARCDGDACFVVYP